MKTSSLSILTVAFLTCSTLAAQATSIVDTKHNLGSAGPGTYISSNEGRVCIFCHTPHRAATNAPLWNREDSVETYVPYDSSTFGGVPAQPNGASKLCLSCHDGSIALGQVVHSDQPITMEAGKEFLTTGKAALGTMLHDDHPISFNYNSSKGGSGVDYLADINITHPVNLDANGDVQCTSCHNVHNNEFGNFLLASDQNSALCLSCHQPSDWLLTPHATSTATWDGQGTDPWADDSYATVAENGCGNCHEPHGAGHAERLLGQAQEEDNCLACHSGHVASGDIATAMNRVSVHPLSSTTGVHDPTEDPFNMTRHVECEDCHDPHVARAGAAVPPGVSGPIMGIDGITSTGSLIDPIVNGYELCYKCHADINGGVSYVPRQIVQTNTRLEFDTSNPSFHPIEGPGTNSDVPSLLPPYTTNSIITCTDCHQSNDSPDAGGLGAKGPHGSTFSPLLIAEFNQVDDIPETAALYALCYRCHSRTSILANVGFSKHSKHVNQTPCSTCHDPHGISSSQGNSTNNSHLMNWNTAVVTPNRNGLLLYESTGYRQGTCYLSCHGRNHRSSNY